MPKQSSITPEALAEFRRRLDAGEQWKAIARDMAARGLPGDRSYWWERLRDVGQRRDGCDAAA